MMTLSKKIAISDATVAFAVFGASAALFLRTLCPTVALSDSGELAAVCKVLGIAHPTGYPLFSLLGSLFARLFFPPVLGTNVMAAVFGAASTAVAYLILRTFDFHKLVAVFSALLLPVGKLLWDVSVVTEVYSFALFAQLCAFLVLCTWHKTSEAKFLVFFSYILALAFANHMTTILYIPAFAILIFVNRAKLSWKLILTCCGSFVLGATIFAYLPIRSACSPILNWGSPHEWDYFVRHVTGWQYRVWMFTKPWTQLLKDFRMSWSIIWNNAPFALPVAILGVLGALTLWRKRANSVALFAAILLVTILFDALYALNYSIPDIDPYFLPTAVVTVFGCALFAQHAFVAKWKGSLVGVILVVASLWANFSSCDRSDDYSAREFAENVLSFMRPNSLAILGNWDMYSPAIYLQLGENLRTDVLLIDYELLRRSWFVRALNKRDEFAFMRRPADEFITFVTPFEQGKPYDPKVLQAAFERMVRSLVVDYRRGEVYSFVQEEFFTRSFPGVPEGLISRKSNLQKRFAAPAAFFEIDATIARRAKWDERQKTIYGAYMRAFFARSHYSYRHNDLSAAEEYLTLAHNFDTTDTTALFNLLVVQMQQNKTAAALITCEKLRPHLDDNRYNLLRRDIIERH